MTELKYETHESRCLTHGKTPVNVWGGGCFYALRTEGFWINTLSLKEWLP